MRRGWEDFVRSVITESVHDPQRAKELYNQLRHRKGCQVARGLFSVDASPRVTQQVRDLLMAELVELIET